MTILLREYGIIAILDGMIFLIRDYGIVAILD